MFERIAVEIRITIGVKPGIGSSHRNVHFFMGAAQVYWLPPFSVAKPKILKAIILISSVTVLSLGAATNAFVGAFNYPKKGVRHNKLAVDGQRIFWVIV